MMKKVHQVTFEENITKKSITNDEKNQPITTPSEPPHGTRNSTQILRETRRPENNFPSIFQRHLTLAVKHYGTIWYL